ncbi:hypothetical protein NW666_000181 [Escherichia albertii]|nr:hypothetical protein [Escherichia albertii]
MSSGTPVKKTLDEIRYELLPQLHFADDDYVGIIDAWDTTLQAIVIEDEERFWIEIPCVAEKGSYGKECEREELVEIFRNVKEKISLIDYPDFQFQSW